MRLPGNLRRRLASILAASGMAAIIASAYTLYQSPGLPGVTIKWNTNNILYYINPTGSGLSINELQPAIQSAFDSWGSQTGITFQYMGTTTAKNDPNDHQNTIFWDTSPDHSFVSPTAAFARTAPTINSNGYIYDADIGFSVGSVGWVLTPPPNSGCTGEAGQLFGGIPLVWNIGQQGIGGITFLTSVYNADVQATATHEIGHFLGLNHTLVQNAVMSIMTGATPAFFCNTDQRNLKADDIAGVNFLYPSARAAYGITDLGTLSGAQSTVATGINSSGAIVGYVYGGSYSCPNAFLYSQGTMTNLGRLLPGGCTVPNHINDNGDLVGYANVSANASQRAFSIRGGQFQFLFSSNENYSRADWISSSGQVVGTVALISPPPGVGPSPAFTWNNGETTYLTKAGGTAEAFSINTVGHIVGQPPFLYESGQLTVIPPVPGDRSGAAVAINDLDQVVGYSIATTGFFRAFRYSGGLLTDLGTLGGHSTPSGINASGVVVGTSNNAAFIYKNAQMLDLNTLVPTMSGWYLSSAQAINDMGQIVGYGTHNGVLAAFLLTPAH